jgi:hypothetical protein
MAIMAFAISTDASGADIPAWLTVRGTFFEGGRLNVNNHQRYADAE